MKELSKVHCIYDAIKSFTQSFLFLRWGLLYKRCLEQRSSGDEWKMWKHHFAFEVYFSPP